MYNIIIVSHHIVNDIAPATVCIMYSILSFFFSSSEKTITMCIITRQTFFGGYLNSNERITHCIVMYIYIYAYNMPAWWYGSILKLDGARVRGE